MDDKLSLIICLLISHSGVGRPTTLELVACGGQSLAQETQWGDREGLGAEMLLSRLARGPCHDLHEDGLSPGPTTRRHQGLKYRVSLGTRCL